MLRARITQIYGSISFNVTQSPYGNNTIITTEKLRTFGRVQLITRNFSSSDNENISLREEIAAELQNAYQNISSNVSSVSVIELESGEFGKILCHHEIVLNDQISPPSFALKLNNSALYSGNSVLFGVGSDPGYFYGETFIGNGLFYNETDLPCRNISSNVLAWRLYTIDQVSNSTLLNRTGESDPSSFLNIAFSNTSKIVAGETTFDLSANNVYGIRQEYLLKTCPETANTTTYYNRIYGAMNPSTPIESDKYTIFHTTGISSFSTDSLTSQSTPNGTGAIINIPSNLVARATSYEFTVDGNTTMLTESDLDSSPTYKVTLSNLTKDAESNVSIQVFVRHHDNVNSNASNYITVLTDTDECIVNPGNCHSNATCTNNEGSFTCACNMGYTGNGTTCNDINECNITTENCHSNATCTNNEGSFTCACDMGYTGNGTTCNDINECNINTGNCHSNATCTNNEGSFTCACDMGYTGNGTTCNDINECNINTGNCHSNATCTNNEGSFTCACDMGYTGNGTTCDDVNECNIDTGNCHSNATCTNNEGSFTCACDMGYTGNGTTCDDVNECNINTDNCHSNATCTNNEGSFTCACDMGYTGNGTTCNDINECNINTDNCYANAICSNTEGSFFCSCPLGYMDNGITCFVAPPTPPAWIAAIVIGIFALIVIVVVAVYRCHKETGTFDVTNRERPADFSMISSEQNGIHGRSSNLSGSYDLVQAQKRIGRMNTGELNKAYSSYLVEDNIYEECGDISYGSNTKGSYDLVVAQNEFNMQLKDMEKSNEQNSAYFMEERVENNEGDTAQSNH